MTESNLNAADKKDIGYGELFTVLLRRRFWLLGVFCGVCSVGGILTLIEKPTYQSSIQLLIEPNYEGKREAIGQQQKTENEFADSNVEVDMATQINLMGSSGLLQKAVTLLRPEYPTIDLDEVKESLIITQVIGKGGDSDKKVGTKIFKVSYEADDPVQTQTVLNIIQNIYFEYNLEQQKLRLAKGLMFINEQLPQARNQLNRAQAALKEFRNRYKLVDPELQAKALTDALNSIRQEQRTNLIQIQQLQSRYETLQQQLARSLRGALVSSRLSESSRYQNLLNEIQKTELALVQQRLQFTDTYPTIEKLLEQRQNQQALLQEEMRRVLGESPTQQNSAQKDLTEGQLGELDLNLAKQIVEVQTNLFSLKASSQGLAQAEQQLSAELQRFPGLLAEYNRLLPEVEVNQVTLQQLLTARQELGLELARGGFDWQVVEKPKLGEQIAPSLKTNFLLSVVVGLMLGIFAAFIREAVDDAVHTSDELKKQVALPLLGITPELPQVRASQPIINLSVNRPPVLEPSIIQTVCWPPFRDSLDLIYKNIRLVNSAFALKSLVVTSALAGEGKTTLALGLAITAARLHQRVLLIDTDLRRPSLHKQLNLPNEQGLSTLLTNETTLPSQSSIQQSSSYFDVLTSGPAPTDPVKLLSSPRMRELITAFEQNYDLVLLDAPPVLGMVDAIQAASLCSGVILVGRIGQVTRTEITQAADMLSKSNVIGVIANGTSSPSNATYTEQHGGPSLRLYQPLVLK